MAFFLLFGSKPLIRKEQNFPSSKPFRRRREGVGHELQCVVGRPPKAALPTEQCEMPRGSQSSPPALYCLLAEGSVGAALTAVLHVSSKGKGPWGFPGISGVKILVLKKEFVGPGLHLRPAHADHARLPLQWTLNSLLSACGNDSGRIRPPPDRGTLKITSRLLFA